MKTRKNPIAEYKRLTAEIAMTIKDIQTGLHHHAWQQDADPSWGLVGDLGHYQDQLKEVADQLNQRGEYHPDNRSTDYRENQR